MSLLVIPYATLLACLCEGHLPWQCLDLRVHQQLYRPGAIGGALFLASLRTEANRKKVLMINTLISALA